MVGLRDRRIGKISPRCRAPAAGELASDAKELFRERTADFTVEAFPRAAGEAGTIKSLLLHRDAVVGVGRSDLVAKAKRRGAHRKKRTRRPLPGMLLFQDGSTHRLDRRRLRAISTSSSRLTMPPGNYLLGLPGRGGGHDVELLRPRSRRSSDTGPVRGAFYTDRGSHYFVTPKGQQQGRQDPVSPRSAARCPSSGITHIPSYSPQARGRMERAFGTLQKRLPQELRLARIKTRSQPPTATSGDRLSCPTTMPASRWPPPGRARPSRRL